MLELFRAENLCNVTPARFWGIESGVGQARSAGESRFRDFQGVYGQARSAGESRFRAFQGWKPLECDSRAFVA